MSALNSKIENQFSAAPTAEIAEQEDSKTALETALEPIHVLLRWFFECQKGVITNKGCRILADNLMGFLDENESVLSSLPKLKQKLDDFLDFLETEYKSKDQIFIDNNSQILPIIQELDEVIKANKVDDDNNIKDQ